MELNLSGKKPPKCANCGKDKGHHKSQTFECPHGPKTRVGYLSYGPATYTPKKKKGG